MIKTDYNVELFRSARAKRVEKIILAPPFLIFAMFAISIAIQIPAGLITRHFSFVLGMLINQVLALLLPALVVIRIFGLSVKQILPFKKVSGVKIATASVMIIGMAVLTDYLIFFTEKILPISQTLSETYEKYMNVTGVFSYLYLFAFLCIIPGFCEEIFFRGFCQTGLVKHYGVKWGIVITALIFAVAHLNPFYLHLYFLLGLVISWLFQSSKTLWIPIICHVVNNWWTFTLYSLGVKLPLGGALLGPTLVTNLIIIGAGLAVFGAAIFVWKMQE